VTVAPGGSARGAAGSGEPHVVVDALGLLCPLPVLRAQQAMARLFEGDLLLLLADDEGVRKDVPEWCRGNGHELVGIAEEPSDARGGRSRYRCLVRKGKAGAPGPAGTGRNGPRGEGR
jgi:TusA-related sulfurtransferase